ncbi:serine/threonine protein kinase [Pyxidicoccus xibeiensis]|uniref:serine/threonine protein kinase n=1 Tax=Pyxidicoccus xibeiensis TaxID=2906759 RepID=UPI0020A82B2C|nr:serine/threonine protein kinase [Pyxidicoccus xibeiensis]MCP3144189.1 phosphotransferase [Pyxidicoccus xibeiensis]
MQQADTSTGESRVRVLSPGALPRGTRVARWEVVCQVGRGGFGTVYAVCEVGRADGPWYALKLAREPEDAGFSREARALSLVSHPGVPRLVAAGTWEAGAAGYPYLVLEYVRGESLYRWGRLLNPTARQVAGLLEQVAGVLEAAHRVGVLHRDFKGDNVVVRPGGQVAVLDWGAGLHPDAQPLTCTERLPPGTPRYFSPQVARWRARARGGGGGRYPYSVADEQYAVGVAFYRLLSDEYPPPQLALAGGWEALEPRPLDSLNPKVPPALSAIVMRLLALRSEERFASMTALTQELLAALEKAGPEWDVPLFDWYAGPGSDSRTTQEGEGEEQCGPVAPGQLAAILRDRQQRREDVAYEGARRWVRRRHPQVLARPQAGAPGPEEVGSWWGGKLAAGAGMAPGPEVGVSRTAAPPSPREQETPFPGEFPEPEPARVPGRSLRRGAVKRMPWSAALLGAVVVGATGLILMKARSMPQAVLGPQAAPGGKVATPAPTPHATAPATVPRWMPPLALLEEPMPAPKQNDIQVLKPGKGAASALKRCVGLVGAAATLAACPGAQLRPVSGTPCPQEALDGMKKLRLRVGSVAGTGYVDTRQPGGADQLAWLRDGSIVSRVVTNVGGLVEGSLLYGRLWTKGPAVIGRYTEAELPDGTRYPVCLNLGDEDGWDKDPESTEELAAITRSVAFTAVKVFP